VILPQLPKKRHVLVPTCWLQVIYRWLIRWLQAGEPLNLRLGAKKALVKRF
jgi:hypothetical protein